MSHVYIRGIFVQAAVFRKLLCRLGLLTSFVRVEHVSKLVRNIKIIHISLTNTTIYVHYMDNTEFQY